MSVVPGKDSILGSGEGLPKLVFMKVALKSSSSSSSSTSSSSLNPTKGKVDGKVCVVATMYPVAWSTYLTPVGTKSGSIGALGRAKGSAMAHTKVPIQPVPVFVGVEGDDVQLWIEKVKLCGAPSGWDTATLLVQVSVALEGMAALWLHTANPEVMFWFKQFEVELTKAFTPFTHVELFKDYLACMQGRNESVQLFYFQLLLIQKHAALTNTDLLASQFWEGLKADVWKGINLLPSSMLLSELLECVVKVELRLWLMPTWATLVAAVTDNKDMSGGWRDTSGGQKDNTGMAELCDSMQELVAWTWEQGANSQKQ